MSGAQAQAEEESDAQGTEHDGTGTAPPSVGGGYGGVGSVGEEEQEQQQASQQLFTWLFRAAVVQQLFFFAVVRPSVVSAAPCGRAHA